MKRTINGAILAHPVYRR